MTVLGVDPTGSGTGAAVARGPDGVVGWWVWTRKKSKVGGWRLQSEWGGRSRVDTVLVDDLVGVAYVVGVDAVAAGVTAVVVEGLYAPEGWAKKTTPANLLVLAEGTGDTREGFARAGLPRSLARPGASPPDGSGWRTRVLGLAPDLAADRAEARTVAWAMGEWSPSWLPPLCWLPRGLTRAEEVAVAEAGAIALWPVAPGGVAP